MLKIQFNDLRTEVKQELVDAYLTAVWERYELLHEDYDYDLNLFLADMEMCPQAARILEREFPVKVEISFKVSVEDL